MAPITLANINIKKDLPIEVRWIRPPVADILSAPSGPALVAAACIRARSSSRWSALPPLRIQRGSY
ncbi:hypothetical protein AGMMS49587_02460 [Spirochaetia bacterium]|nr:hypothetical protein AGMMS49587_02460 [Spirochaetia bacterium]